MKPIPPKPNTLDARALQLLRSRGTLTSPEFQSLTGSWRLAASIHRLRKLNWPIAKAMVYAPLATSPKREIASYFLGLTDE